MLPCAPVSTPALARAQNASTITTNPALAHLKRRIVCSFRWPLLPQPRVVLLDLAAVAALVVGHALAQSRVGEGEHLGGGKRGSLRFKHNHSSQTGGHTQRGEDVHAPEAV